MIEIPYQQMSQIAPLFRGWEETMVWSCLQGCMGRAWADSAAAPRSARILIGDFCFLAGAPQQALLWSFPQPFPSSFLLLVPRSQSWGDLIRQTHPASQPFTRYAIRKGTVFDRKLLERYTRRLPAGYTLRRIDRALYHTVLQTPWCKDFCSQFPSWESYAAHGLGVLALRGGEIASGASSYTYYKGGIEIEVDTNKPHTRQGLALACAAQLILDCLDKNLYPSWDAANPASVRLAEKLGYRLAGEYETFFLPLAK